MREIKNKLWIIISIKMYATSNKKVRDPKQDKIQGEAHKQVSLAPGISKPIFNRFFTNFGPLLIPQVTLQLIMSSQMGEMITCSIHFFLVLNFSHFYLFAPGSTCFIQFFGYGSKSEHMKFCTGMYTIPKWKRAKGRKKLVIK